MKIHLECVDNLSVLLWPNLNKLDPENSLGGAFAFMEERAYEVFHRDYLLPSAAERVNHLTYELHSRVFTVTHMNKRNFNYSLEFDNGVVLEMTPAMRYKSVFAKIRVNQPAVWHLPFEKIRDVIAWLRKVIGPSFQVKPDLIDLATHTSGWNLTIDDRLHLTGSYKKKKIHPVPVEDGNSFSGMEIGTKSSKSRSRSIFVRIYDKTMHLRQQHSSPRPHIFYSIPANEEDRIWNIEASFNSRFLKSVQIETLDKLEKNLPNLWKIATEQYLKHKSIPRMKKKDRAFEKAPLSEQWLIIQKCHQVTETTEELLKKAERLVDIDGTFQINKMKKRILRYAVINEMNPYDLEDVLKDMREVMTVRVPLGSLNWKEFVDRHYPKKERIGELIDTEL